MPERREISRVPVRSASMPTRKNNMPVTNPCATNWYVAPVAAAARSAGLAVATAAPARPVEQDSQNDADREFKTTGDRGDPAPGDAARREVERQHTGKRKKCQNREHC